MGYQKRLEKAENTAARANRLFEKLEAEYLTASREQREVYDELTVEIQRLEEVRERAFNHGLANEARAKKVRETFL